MARPARAHRKVTKEEEIAELTKKMEKAAKSENYELAARLRDKISELKQAEETENTDKEKTAGQEGAANEA